MQIELKANTSDIPLAKESAHFSLDGTHKKKKENKLNRIHHLLFCYNANVTVSPLI